MTTQTHDDLSDLMADDLAEPDSPAAQKGRALPAKLTPKQKKQASAAKRKAEKQALAKKEAKQLAQIINLQISGFSLSEIGAAIGADADEVDRMLNRDISRYVRNQPALRVYVRNWISAKYTKMIEADWDAASDKTHPHKLEHQDRVDRFLRSMAKLHGADAPVQTEVKVETAPEAVEQLVNALAAGNGLGYDDTVFDVVDAEIVEDAVEQSERFLETSSDGVGEGDEQF